MTGTEMQILRIVAEQSGVGAASVARSMGVSREYVDRIMQALAKDGYLQDSAESGYAITHKGAKAVAPYAGRDGGGRVAVSSFP